MTPYQQAMAKRDEKVLSLWNTMPREGAVKMKVQFIAEELGLKYHTVYNTLRKHKRLKKYIINN